MLLILGLVGSGAGLDFMAKKAALLGIELERGNYYAYWPRVRLGYEIIILYSVYP